MSEQTTATLTPAEGEGEQEGRTFTQAEVNEIVARRAKQAARQLYGDLDPKDVATLQERAQQYDALVAASRTDQERAVEEARQTAATETATAYQQRLVTAEFRAAAAVAGVPFDRVQEWLEDVNLGNFVKNGEVDLERVASKVGTFAGTPTGGNTRPPTPDFGQGHRTAVVPSGREAGLAEARRRFGNPQ